MISLCMIVRDEAPQLPRFLASTAGLWDELCVADTGSLDTTREILQAAGARIIDFPWIEDFAAARNASLALAQGDWIIYLDADEYPDPGLIAEIRQLERDPEAGAATLLMRNLRDHGRIEEQRLLRIFRRDACIVFKHAIHESASSSISAMLQAKALHTRHLSGHVEHIGYQPTLMQHKNKRQRDQRILEASLAQEPNDLYSAFKLLELANYWTDTALAEQASLHLLKQLESLPADGLLKHHWAADLLARLARTLYPSAAKDALRLLARHAVTPTQDFLETRGLFFEASGQRSAAHDDFVAALSLSQEGGHPGAMQVTSLLGLCRLALEAGDMAKAHQLSGRAIELSPCNTTALQYDLMLADLAGGKPAAQQRLAELARHYGPTPELASVAAGFGLTAISDSVLAP